jgi:hydrogenase expression/formation protein HypD
MMNDFSSEDVRDVEALAQGIERITKRNWTVMEVCGGQTHAILKNGIDQLLPPRIRIVHGPGCPVCVTSIEVLDRAIEIASRDDVVLCTYGDMLRVPGTKMDLARIRSQGGKVRVIHSPLDACKIASEELRLGTGRQVVLFAIGFETTAPATAMAVRAAHMQSLSNFSVLVSHVLVPPAVEAILNDPDHGIDGILAAGHVCAITGYEAYEGIAERYRTPIAVTGFSPADILRGMLAVITELESLNGNVGRLSRVINAYVQVVERGGNAVARSALEEVFECCDQVWRGMGTLPQSGLVLRPKYQAFDAAKRFASEAGSFDHPVLPTIHSLCRAADVLKGKIRPTQCEAFGKQCTPAYPLGAPMVSNEGACAAYYHHQTQNNPGVMGE